MITFCPPLPKPESFPTALPPLLKNVPEELKSRRQWVCWRYAQPTDGNRPRWMKVPISPLTQEPAKPNEPRTWVTFPQAVIACNSTRYDGIGFMYSPADPFVGVDLDECRGPDTGTITPWARECIHLLNTYTEISPSGRGVKCILRGSLPSHGRKKAHIELYASHRFFAITGHVIEPLTDIADRSTELLELHSSVFGLQPVTTTIPPPEPSVPPLPVPDHEIIRRASRARNGQKFMRLWKGSTVDAENDHSAADLALCRLLGFWCGPRPDRIDALFRQSSLFRPKWDDAHYADGRTYGEATVEKAIQCQGETQYKWGPLTSSCHPT